MHERMCISVERNVVEESATPACSLRTWTILQYRSQVQQRPPAKARRLCAHPTPMPSSPRVKP